MYPHPRRMSRLLRIFASVAAVLTSFLVYATPAEAYKAVDRSQVPVESADADEIPMHIIRRSEQETVYQGSMNTRDGICIFNLHVGAPFGRPGVVGGPKMFSYAFWENVAFCPPGTLATIETELQYTVAGSPTYKTAKSNLTPGLAAGFNSALINNGFVSMKCTVSGLFAPYVWRTYATMWISAPGMSASRAGPSEGTLVWDDKYWESIGGPPPTTYCLPGT